MPHRPRFVDAGSIAAGLKQGETHSVPAGEEGAAGEAVAIACDPMTLAVMPYVEMMG